MTFSIVLAFRKPQPISRALPGLTTAEGGNDLLLTAGARLRPLKRFLSDGVSGDRQDL
jgi:hypothetical protein